MKCVFLASITAILLYSVLLVPCLRSEEVAGATQISIKKHSPLISSTTSTATLTTTLSATSTATPTTSTVPKNVRAPSGLSWMMWLFIASPAVAFLLYSMWFLFHALCGAIENRYYVNLLKEIPARTRFI